MYHSTQKENSITLRIPAILMRALSAVADNKTRKDWQNRGMRFCYDVSVVGEVGERKNYLTTTDGYMLAMVDIGNCPAPVVATKQWVLPLDNPLLKTPAKSKKFITIEFHLDSDLITITDDAGFKSSVASANPKFFPDTSRLLPTKDGKLMYAGCMFNPDMLKKGYAVLNAALDQNKECYELYVNQNKLEQEAEEDVERLMEFYARRSREDQLRCFKGSPEFTAFVADIAPENLKALNGIQCEDPTEEQVAIRSHAFEEAAKFCIKLDEADIAYKRSYEGLNKVAQRSLAFRSVKSKGGIITTIYIAPMNAG